MTSKIKQNGVEKNVQRDLYAMVNELKKTNSLSRGYQMVKSLEMLQELIDDNNLNINYPKEYEFEMNKFDIDKFDINYLNLYYQLNYKPMLEYNKKLCKMSSYIKRTISIPKVVYMKDRLNIKQTYQIANDFLNYFDKNMYDYFNYLTNKQRVFLGNVDCEGMATHANHVIEPYIILTPNETIDDSLTMAHELVHAYLLNKQRYFCEAEDLLYMINNYYEVYSIFIELVFQEYLIDHKIFQHDVIECAKKEIGDLCCYLDSFKDSAYLDHDVESYCYGHILAYHFYNQYKINPKEAKNNIYNFMLDAKDHEKMYMLNHYGLTMENIVNAKKLKRYINKHLERLNK